MAYVDPALITPNCIKNIKQMIWNEMNHVPLWSIHCIKSTQTWRPRTFLVYDTTSFH